MEEPIRVQQWNRTADACACEDYALLLVAKGEIRFAAPRQAGPARAGDALLLQAGVKHACSASPDAQALEIRFSRAAFFQTCLPVIEGCPLLAGFFVHEKQRGDLAFLHFLNAPEETRTLAARMLSEYEAQGALWQSVLVCELIALLLQLSRSCRVETIASEAPGEQALQQVLSYLAAHSADATLESVAAHFNYHPNTISGMIKKGTGKTFQQIRQQIRLSRAAQLLLREIPAQQVAELCGYTNMSNFYTQFTRKYGSTPGQYARRTTSERKQA